MAAEKTASFVYAHINSTSAVVPSQERWSDKLDDSDCNVNKLVSLIKDFSSNTKLHSFQYRLLHRAVITNKHLARWKILESDMCTFCGKEVETYFHLFWDCSYAQAMWAEVVKLCSEIKPDVSLRMSYPTVIKNNVVSSPKNVVNSIVLICKQYIYRKKCYGKRPERAELRSLVWQCKNIEKYYAIKTSKISKFLQKWESTDSEVREMLENAE